MMNLFLKKRSFVWFLMFFAMILGFSSMMGLPRESMPEIKIPIVGVTTVYPGASSFDVEKLITDPLEKQFLRTLKNVNTIQSTSNEGMSLITIQFEGSVDIKDALVGVRDEIDRVSGTLPSDSLDPIASEFSFSDMPIFVVSLSSEEAYTQLSTTVKQVEEHFLGISGVSKVQIDGIPEREITLILDKSSLDQYGLTPSEVIQKVAQSNFSIPAGSFVQNGVEYGLRIDNSLEGVEDIQNIIVRTLSPGNYLRVKDVAVIEDGLAPYTSLSRLSTQGSDTEQAITFSIFKQVDADITTVTKAARKKIIEIQNIYPETQFVTVIDWGKDVADAIGELSMTALQTIILVVLILSLGLSIKAAMVTAITVPLSFFLTFIGLQYTGTSLNFISLFALILSVGLLVDASIVIIEGITVAQSKGMNVYEAIKHTLKEYAQPVIIGNLTTIVVFIPMVAMPGIIGEFIRSIPLTIVLVLIASLIVALVFVPLLSTFKRKTSHTPQWIRSLDTYRDIAFKKLDAWYTGQLEFYFASNKRKRRFFWSVIGAFVFFLSLLGLGVIKSEFFPVDDFKEINVSVSLPQGSQIADVDNAILGLESYLQSHEYIDSFVTKVYSDNATITVLADKDKNGKKVLADIRSFITTVPGNISMTALPPANGPSSGAPVSIRIMGDDYDAMVAASGIVENILSSIPGTIDVDSSVSDSNLDIVLSLRHGQLADTGLDGMFLAGVIRNSLFGAEATTIRRNGEDVSVVVKTAVNENYFASSETRHITLDQLRSIPIPTLSGTSPLGLFVEESVTGNTPSIQREDGDRVVTISSYLENGYILSDVITPFIQAMQSTSLPQGVSWSFGGDAESSAEAGADLMNAVMIGMALVFAVLVYQFNSIRKTFLILSVIPLGLIGVLFGLLVLNQPLSFISMLGFVTLSALVINNSIILIDVFTKLEEEGELSGVDIITTGAVRRLRPILLTTATTVIGMIPLLFTSPMWQPLAVAIIFGLLFATIITLMLIPIIYSWWGMRKQKTNE